jgi:hypothetical protein
VKRIERTLAGLVTALAVLSVSVGVLLVRDRERTLDLREERDAQFALVCDSITGLREGLLRAFGNLGTDLNDPTVRAEINQLRRVTDCVTGLPPASNLNPNQGEP